MASYITGITSGGGFAHATLTESVSNANQNKSTYSGQIGVSLSQDEHSSAVVKAYLYNGNTLLASLSYLCIPGGVVHYIDIASFDIAHNPNGSGSWNLRLVCVCGDTNELSQTITCTSIERRSSISLSGNKTYGNTESVSVIRLVSGSYARLLVKVGSSPNIEIAPKTTGNLSISYSKWIAGYQDSMTKSATAYLYTYDSNNNTIGYRTYSINLVIDASDYTFDFTCFSVPTKYGNDYVQNRNGTHVEMNATLGGNYADYGTTYNKFTISVDGMSGQVNGQSGSWESGYFQSSGIVRVYLTAYDSHGRSVSKQISLSVLAYTNPTITNLVVERNGSNNVDFSFTLNKQMNWALSGIASNSGSGTGNISGSFTLLDTASGTLNITATDQYEGSSVLSVFVAAKGRYISFGKVNGTKSVCFGDVPTHEGAEFKMPIYDTNDGSNGFGDHVVSQGSNANYIWRKWSSGLLEQWFFGSIQASMVAYNNEYRVDISSLNRTFPVSFVGNVRFSGAAFDGVAVGPYLSFSACTTTTWSANIMSPKNHGNQNWRVSAYFMGYWK